MAIEIGSVAIRRGNKAQLPTLPDGQFGLCEDTKEVFIGTTTGNAQVAMATQKAWIAPTLVNSWVNFGSSGYATAGYVKLTVSLVKLKGYIKSGVVSPGTIIFTLPFGYRPLENLRFVTVNYNGTSFVAATIDVMANGQVQIVLATNNELSLDGIIFLAEQ